MSPKYSTIEYLDKNKEILFTRKTFSDCGEIKPGYSCNFSGSLEEVPASKIEKVRHYKLTIDF